MSSFPEENRQNSCCASMSLDHIKSVLRIKCSWSNIIKTFSYSIIVLKFFSNTFYLFYCVIKVWILNGSFPEPYCAVQNLQAARKEGILLFSELIGRHHWSLSWKTLLDDGGKRDVFSVICKLQILMKTADFEMCIEICRFWNPLFLSTSKMEYHMPRTVTPIFMNCVVLTTGFGTVKNSVHLIYYLSCP